MIRFVRAPRRPLRPVLSTVLLGAALAAPPVGAAEPASSASSAAEPTAVAEAVGTGGEDAAPDTASAASDEAHECAAADDFPTTAVADYVLGCMAANGNSYEALQQCSCSIDFIKSRMAYADYEQASTILQVQLDVGQRGVFYRDSTWAKRRVERLEALQAESPLRCF